jgi:large subunit ribosomal protein L18e
MMTIFYQSLGSVIDKSSITDQSKKQSIIFINPKNKDFNLRVNAIAEFNNSVWNNMKSKARIEKKAARKTNFALVEAIMGAKKLDAWNKVSDLISSPRRKSIALNLGEISEMSKDGESVVVPGKVLSEGEISRKIRLVALKYSEKAREKLARAKVSFSYINEEIKKNPDAKGLRILSAEK